MVSTSQKIHRLPASLDGDTTRTLVKWEKHKLCSMVTPLQNNLCDVRCIIFIFSRPSRCGLFTPKCSLCQLALVMCQGLVKVGEKNTYK